MLATFHPSKANVKVDAKGDPHCSDDSADRAIFGELWQSDVFSPEIFSWVWERGLRSGLAGRSREGGRRVGGLEVAPNANWGCILV